MSRIVKKETKTFTRPDPDNPNKLLVTTETIEVLNDGLTVKSVKTSNRQSTSSNSPLKSFHAETLQGLQQSKHGYGNQLTPINDNPRIRNGGSVGVVTVTKNGSVRTQLDPIMIRPSGTRPGSSTSKAATASADSKDRSQASGADSEEFESQCILAHNQYRARHNAPPLRRSPQLSQKAQTWAQKLAKEDRMVHDTNTNYGENIYSKWSSDANQKLAGNEPVDSWYSEIKDHNFSQEPSPGRQMSGHFSQVVWLRSAEVGVGQARSGSGRVYVVANYSPAGNFLGDYMDNVPPLGGFAADHKPKRSVPGGSSTKDDSISTTDGSREGRRPSSAGNDQFDEECLRAHNVCRKKHGVQPLTLNKSLCAYSQEWADKLAEMDRMQHRKQTKYGENIFSLWSSDRQFRLSGREPVDSWYSEINQHPFGQEPQFGVMKSGHFSQIVWKKSRELGVGKAHSKSGKIIVVTNYEPAGNRIGEFGANVPRSQ